MTLNQNVLAQNVLMDNSFLAAQSFIVNAERKFTQVKTLVVGGDDTLFAKVDGVVRFERFGRDRKKVSVYPVAQEA